MGKTRFFEKILPDNGGVEIFSKTGGLTLFYRQNPKFPLRLITERPRSDPLKTDMEDDETEAKLKRKTIMLSPE
ncbi:hypothetical protein HMPREF9441_00684 [Paraprevotella clara YIT 11840]|uniref:Uncharacterized protein n=1 Tax=Paraprevotella clara YIT 11840 TaxID=762968 RepID=G5SMV6_9BACT|nr:hypothetical protein HMPREF9441_00684 [Paraprevotella clara YIT 11840]